MLFSSSPFLSVRVVPLGLPCLQRNELTVEIGGFLSANVKPQLCLVHASVINI